MTQHTDGTPAGGADPASVLAEASAWVAGLVDGIPASSWAGAGLGEWDLRALVGHTSRALVTVHETLARPTPATVELRDAEDYFLRVSELQTADPRAVMLRGVEAGAALGADPAGAFRRLATETLAIVRATGDPVVGTIAGAMRFEDYISTRIFELVVHGLDIRAATEQRSEPPLASLLSVAALTSRLAVRRGLGAELLLALTGRAPLPEGLSVLGASSKEERP